MLKPKTDPNEQQANWVAVKQIRSLVTRLELAMMRDENGDCDYGELNITAAAITSHVNGIVNRLEGTE